MTENYPVLRSGDSTQGAYTINLEDADRPAQLTWLARGTARVANHTYVPPEARGLGLAAKLVEALVDDARSEGFSIHPSCSYVDALFRRHPEWNDVRAKDWRKGS